ncbi:MAG: hypothetical protein RIC03_16090 [Cyclobacteriaceae bacterium]
MSRSIKSLHILFLLICAVGCYNGLEKVEPIKEAITPSTAYSYIVINTNRYHTFTYDLIVRAIDNSKVDTIKVPDNVVQLYQWLNGKLLYEVADGILEYNPETNESKVIKIQSYFLRNFHATDQFIAFNDLDGIFLYDFTSQNITEIERIPEGDARFPVILPDGENVLYAERGSLKDENTGFSISYFEYKVYDIETKKTRDIVMPDELAFLNYRLSWIYGSENMLYSQPSYLSLFNPRTKESRRLTNEETVATTHNISPDGTKVSYLQSDRSRNGDNWQSFLTVLDLSDFSEEILFRKTTYQTAWSPTSDKLLYSYPSGISLYDFETATTQELVNLTDTNQFIVNIQWIK